MYGGQGIGADEDFGPPAPTGAQIVTQAVTDITQDVEEVTGIPNVAYYIGIGLIGYVLYQYFNE